MKTSEIQIRDPFILVDGGKYYMYGTTDKNCWGDEAWGFDAYVSEDLENWDGPYQAFKNTADFWATKNFWAPEVYKIDGKYYMFASFFSKTRMRGTQILVSDNPLANFKPLTKYPVTPENWMCLDGTLYIENGEKYMVFCHEWTQACDGEICLIKLSGDFTRAESEPVLLFKASDAKWVMGFKNGEGKMCYVTDGPFLHKCPDGTLLMLWSSHSDTGYALGLAKSETGSVKGPWVLMDEPFYRENGGHGMIFRALDGKLYIAIHAPNNTPNERPHFIEITDEGGTIKAVK